MKNFWNRAFTLVGRTGVALFALVLFIHGSTKNVTNETNAAEVEAIGSLMAVADGFKLSEWLLEADESAAEMALLWVLVGIVTNAAAKYAMSTNAMVYRPWAVRGGFQDRFWLDFGDWAFPLGSNEYSKVAVSTWGEIWSEWNNEEKKIAAVGVPMAAVPGVSTFWWAEGENDSRILTWKDFALSRDTNTLVSAQMVLKANGDFTLSSNEVVRSFQRVETFDWDGKTVGQTDEEREHVAAEVGVRLENGYYRFRATFPKAPRRRTLLTVGTNHVVVTEAGDYDFLLEKGIEYTFGTDPVNTNVIYTAVDDMPRENENGLMMMANEAGATSGTWTVDGGWLRLIEPTFSHAGWVFWMPRFTASPDIVHVGPGELSFTCAANFMDGKEPQGVSYFWSVRQGDVIIESLRARETNVRIGSMPNWNPAELEVTAKFGTNSLTSSLKFSYGKNSEPYSYLSLSAPSLILKQGCLDVGSEDVTMNMTFSSDWYTNGVVRIEQIAGSEFVRASKALPQTYTIRNGIGCSDTIKLIGIKESEHEGDVQFRCSFIPDGGAADSIEGTIACTVFEPRKVEVVDAPSTGLAVVKGANVAVQLSGKPESVNHFSRVSWRTAKRRTEKEYDAWNEVAYSYTTNGLLPMSEAGVFALGACVSCGGQTSTNILFLCKEDECTMPEFRENELGPRRKGQKDHIGVASSAGLLRMRNLALQQLGSTQYSIDADLPARYSFSKVKKPLLKCNRFVADVATSAGYSVPVLHTVMLINTYPPLANEWAYGNVEIEGWEYLGTSAYPEPGFIVGHPNPNGSGHCGIVDYDGWTISARSAAVTRKALRMLDGTSGYNKPNQDEE